MPRYVACGGCGARIQHGATSRPEGQARCRSCQRDEVTHGSVAMYRKRGCRCASCKQAATADMRTYVAKRNSEGRPAKRVRSTNRGRRYNLSRAQRLAIYDRDGWVCKLCLEPVDRSLHWNDLLAPTLDHIIPQSATLLPDHSPANLQLAHRICNARKGASLVS